MIIGEVLGAAVKRRPRTRRGRIGRVASGSFAGWNLPPDAFAVVMATGIVAIAGYDHGYWRLGIALSVLAVVTFGALAVHLLRRVATRPPRIMALARDPGVPLRMFAFVAACAVLGVRFNDHLAAVWLLGGLAFVAWLGLVPLALVAAGSTPGIELREQARGGWLLPSVAAAGLAMGIANLLDDPPLRRKMGLAGSFRLQHELNWEKSIDQLYLAYDRTLGKQGEPHN